MTSFKRIGSLTSLIAIHPKATSKPNLDWVIEEATSVPEDGDSLSGVENTGVLRVTWESRAIGVFNSTPVFGRQHAYWHPAGWLRDMGVHRLPGDGHRRARPPIESRPFPWVVHWSNQSGDHYFGVYVPTRFGGELTFKATDGKVVELKGPNGLERGNGQEIGLDQQGWFTFKVVGAHKPYNVETKFVQVAQSVKKPWNFYYWPTKADSIHEPWAGGNGRVDTDLSMVRGDDQLIRQPGSYIPPGEDIVLAGPNGLLETLPPPGEEATWFPNLYDDLTWTGPNKEKGGEVTIFQTPCPLLKYDQIFNTSGEVVGIGQQSKQGDHPLAWPLPWGCCRLDPAQRANSCSGKRSDQR